MRKINIKVSRNLGFPFYIFSDLLQITTPQGLDLNDPEQAAKYKKQVERQIESTIREQATEAFKKMLDQTLASLGKSLESMEFHETQQ